MTIEKSHAGILIYEIINGRLFQRQYIGYTTKEAKALFKNEIIEEQQIYAHKKFYGEYPSNYAYNPKVK